MEITEHFGHGISDVDTGELLHIDDGDLYQAQIVGIQKGSSGSPGELSGLIHYEAEKIIGSIEKNCEQGIYGKLSELPEELGLRRWKLHTNRNWKSDRHPYCAVWMERYVNSMLR